MGLLAWSGGCTVPRSPARVATAGGGLERHEYKGLAMGVQVRCVAWGPPGGLREAASAAFDRVEALDHALSDWSPTSELAHVVAHGSDGWVPVSADLWAVLARALAIARATDGAFDPALGALTKLWRRARQSGTPQTDAEREEALERSGWRHVELDPATRSVRFTRPGIELDLGAIGKGWAADQLLGTFGEHGVERALVDVGGDLALGASPPFEATLSWPTAAATEPLGLGAAREPHDGWRIRLPDGHLLRLARVGIATSGAAEQHLEQDERRLSHILDPRSGQALAGAPTVTAIARDGATADALASAASVLGIVACEALVRAHPTCLGPARLLAAEVRIG